MIFDTIWRARKKSTPVMLANAGETLQPEIENLKSMKGDYSHG
jgi:hypothetical protein